MVTLSRISLSEMASRILRIDRHEAFAHEEIAVYNAPSECYGDVARGCERARLTAFQEGGWTPEEFAREVRSRTSDKWMYFNTDWFSYVPFEEDFSEYLGRLD